jgi:hypothetical protein
MKLMRLMRIVILFGMLMLTGVSLLAHSVSTNPSNLFVVSRRYLTQEEFYQKYDKRIHISAEPSRLIWNVNTLLHAKANIAFSYKILFADVDQYSTVDNPTKKITVLSQPKIERNSEVSKFKQGAFQVRDRKKGLSSVIIVQKNGTGDFYEAIIGGVTKKETGSYVESFILKDATPDFSTHEGIEYLSDGTSRACYFEEASPAEKNLYKDEDVEINVTILLNKEIPQNGDMNSIVNIRNKKESDFNNIVHSYHK